MALVSFPAMVFAQEMMPRPLPSAVPQVIDLSKEIKELSAAVALKQQQNRNVESSLAQLVSENATLSQTIMEQQKTIAVLRGQISSARPVSDTAAMRDILGDREQYGKLKNMLTNYSAQITEHSKMVKDQDAVISELRSRVEKVNHIFDQAVDITYTVGQARGMLKVPPPVVVDHRNEMDALAATLADQKNALESKNALLADQAKQLAELKDELAKTKEQLKEVQKQYGAIIHQAQVAVMPPAPVMPAPVVPAVSSVVQLPIQAQVPLQVVVPDPLIEARLTSKIAAITQLTTDLNDKDQALAKLNTVIAAKDEEIVALKKALAEAQTVIDGRDAEIARLHRSTPEKVMVEKVMIEKVMVTDTEANEELVKMKGEVAALNYQLETNVEDMAENQQQINILNIMVDDLKSKNERAEQDRAQAQNREQVEAKNLVVGLKNKTNILTIEAKGLRTRVDEKVAQLHTAQERDALYAQLSAKHKEYIALLQEKAALINQKVQRAGEKSLDIEAKLQQTMRLWRDSGQDAQQKTEELRRSIDQRDEDIARLNKKIDERETVTARADERLAESERRLEETQQRLRKSMDVNEEQRSKVAAAEERLKKLKEQITAKDLSVSMMQSIIDTKSAAQTETKTALAAQVDQYKTDMAALQERLTVAEAKIRDSVSTETLTGVKTMLKAAQNEVNTLTTSLKQKDADINQMRSDAAPNAKELSAQTAQLQQMTVQVDKSQEKIKELTEALDWKDKQIARLKIQLDESKQPSAITALSAKLKAAEAQLKQANVKSDPHQIKEALKDAQEQIKALREELNQKEDATMVKGLKEQLNAARLEISRLKTQITKVRSTPAATAPGNQGYLMRTSQAAEELVDDTQEKIKILEDKLSEETARNAQWQFEYYALDTDFRKTQSLLQDCRDKTTGMSWIKQQLKSSESNLVPTDK